MADELIENAEFGKKRKNEEDPILIAQRFLNIYRQMHIFNHSRQEQFNNMLLDMPPDIRILLSTLPGGSLLLEYIEEIEEKRGLSSVPIKSANSFRKGSAKELLKQNTPVTEKTSNKQSSGGGVVIDASFASELSSSLSIALQQTERRYKEDIKTLTETITQSVMQSQAAMANMMKDILLASHQPIKNAPSQTIIANKSDFPALSALSETSAEKLASSMPASTSTQKSNKKEPVEAVVVVPAEEPKTEDAVVVPAEEPKTEDVVVPAEEPKTEDVVVPAEEPKTEAVVVAPAEEPKTEDVVVAPAEEPKTEDVVVPAEEPKTEAAVVAPAEEPKTEDAVVAPVEEIKAESPALQAEAPMDLPTEKPSVNLGRIGSLSKDLSKRMGLGKNKQKENTPINLTEFDDKEDSAIILDTKNDSDADFNFDELLGSFEDSSSDISLSFDEPEKNVYQDELEQIRQAIKGEKATQQPILPDNISEKPILLDEISEKPISLDDVLDSSTSQMPTESAPTAQPQDDDQDWEWEYVDDDTNQSADENSDEWEWEYVEDEATDEDSDEWEWEYVEDGDNDTADVQK